MVFIVKHMAGVDAAGFQSNEVLQDSMMFRLIQISENAEKISEKYKTKHKYSKARNESKYRKTKHSK